MPQRECFRSAACALPRSTRARPLICSLVMGFFLCGIAEEPFCFSLKYSWASRTSVRCRCRTSTAILSSVLPIIASVAIYAACRSRWMTCVATGAGFKPKPRADALFVLRLQMAEGSHRARKLAHAHVFGGGIKAGQVALHLGVPVQQLEPEGRRLGVDAVRAADGRRVLELQRAALQHRQQRHNPRRESVPRPPSPAVPAPYRRRRSR